MNWQHLKAIAWLRYRLSANQWKRGGTLNAILGAIILMGALVTSVSSFFVALLVGIFVLPKANPDHLLLVWSGMVILFVVFWMIGLVSDLQRSEALSLDKLLHLPISPSGTFLLNYASSLISISLLVFLPGSIGLCIALTVVKGPTMLVLFVLLFSSVFMVTAVTHQFRGWLFALMVNKRRRRTIIAIVTTVFLLCTQIPNLLNLTVLRNRRSQAQSEYQTAFEQLSLKKDRKEISPEHFADQVAVLKKERTEKRQEERKERYRHIVNITRVVTMVLPIGWLPYGAWAAGHGSLLPGILGSLGAFAIGSASLWRSYCTTLRIYTGAYSSGGHPRRVASEIDDTTPAQNVLEKSLPFVSEQVSVVALASFRSLVRIPQVRMLLLTPIILTIVFVTMMIVGGERNMPATLRPFVAIGVVGLAIFCLLQLFNNMFGHERGGFRLYVLAPCPRRDILLGKNLSIAPLVLGLCLVALVSFQFFYPMRFTYFLATLVQTVSAYMIFCTLGNLVSVLFPATVSTRSNKPADLKFTKLIAHVFATILSPIALIPTFVSLGIGTLSDYLGCPHIVPVYLMCSIAVLFVVFFAYRRLLSFQGRLLQQREQKILEVVTAGVE